MSGHGAPTQPTPRAEHLRVAVVAASWHEEVMDGLLAGARRGLAEAGVEPLVVRVPGSFELPVAAARLARSGMFDVLVALGVVVRGGTPHFDYVCSAATSGLTQVAVETGVPVGFGVLTCDDDEQARDRAGLTGSREDKGYEAAQAAVVTALALEGVLLGSPPVRGRWRSAKQVSHVPGTPTPDLHWDDDRSLIPDEVTDPGSAGGDASRGQRP